MSNFIIDETPLPIDKINLNSLPPGSDPRQWVVATEWITAMQALIDVRGFFRGAPWLGMTPNVVDPVPSGVAKYIWLKSDGTLWKTIDAVATEIGTGGGGGAGPFALPEQWSYSNVPASQVATVAAAAVSTEFDAIRTIRAGSIVGLSARLTAAVSAGTLTVGVTVNGVIQATLNVVMVSGTVGQTVVATGTVPYAAGDLIGVVLTTDGAFAPTTTDLEAWVEVSESIGSPGVVPTVERLSTDAVANPIIDTTFVSGVGTDLTLANGSTDGFIKNFVVTGGTGTITPLNLADGNVLTWTVTPANVSFIWDVTGSTWHVYGSPYNMVTT